MWTLGAGQSATAQTIQYSDLMEGSYTGCNIKEDGKFASVTTTVKFKAASGHIPGNEFISRGLALYTYDEQGKLRRPAEFWAVALNGEGTNMYKAFSEFGLDYGGTSSQFKYWSNRSAFTAQLEVKVTLTDLAKWPAFGVRMANVANDSASTIVLDSAGLLYVSPGMKTCQVVNPSNPPPSPVNTEITVTAPDWDLGELERGKETMRTFTTDAQRLCFRYNAKYIEYDKYLISASNRNGVAEGKFLLANADDGNQKVPYTLSLAGGGAPVPLPSINGLPLTLGKSGQTCLTPTFKAWAGADVKGGDFGDVLTFTITTQP